MCKLLFKFYLILGMLTLSGLVSWAFPYPLFAKVYIDIDNPTAKKIPIAIPGLTNEGAPDAALGNTAANLLMRDLDFTGYFQMIDPKGFWVT